MTYFLVTGQKLRVDEYLTAPDLGCFLIMQGDGNLCLYQGSGPATKRECIWEALSHSMPTGKKYFAIMQADGNLCVYREKVEDPTKTEFVWGTGTQAAGGRFMAVVEDGGLLTVRVGESDERERQRVLWSSRCVRVLTFNTHLIEGSNIEAGAKLAGKLPVVFRDDERHAFIVQKIKQSGADVVGLQEVWSAKRMDRIREDLKDIYPHSIRGTSGIPTRAGSGIVLVSKYPLEDWQFNQYAETPEEDSEDAWATKGVLSATVILVKDRVKLRVGMTHAWINAGSNCHCCPNIHDLLGWTVGDRGHVPAILMGDFNVHRIGDSPKFDEMETLMTEHGATDSWTRVHGFGQAPASATDDQIHNTLDQFFSPSRDTPTPDCLDYVYLKNGTHTPLRPVQATVLHDWKYALKTSTPAWYWVHSGTTDHLPAATVFGDRLCIATRSAQNRRLQVSLFDRATRQWQHDTLCYVTSDGAPGLVWFDGRLQLFFQQGGRVLKMESADGRKWSSPQDLGEAMRSSGGLCAVVHQATLYVFCRDPSGNQVCVHRWRTGGWAERQWVGIDTQHDISGASLGNVLCVVTIDAGSGRSHGLMRAVLDESGKWTAGQLDRNVTTSGSPGIASSRGRFELFYRDPDGAGMFHRSSPDGKTWSGLDFDAHLATANSVCPVASGDDLLLFFPHVRESSEVYPELALAHCHYPPGVDLDASDHYPYQVDLVWPPG